MKSEGRQNVKPEGRQNVKSEAQKNVKPGGRKTDSEGAEPLVIKAVPIGFVFPRPSPKMPPGFFGEGRGLFW